MKEDGIFLYFNARIEFQYGCLFFGGAFMIKKNVREIAASAIFGSIGFILMLLEFPLPIIPSFIKFDFSEIPAIIMSFAFGPLWGVLVCLIKNLLHLFVTTSLGVGELSNFILGAIFVWTAGFCYKKNKTRKGALIGSVFGALTMAVISIFTNYLFVYPAFSVIYGLPMNAILGMYKAILPTVDGLFEALVIFNLPFNFVKGILDAAFCFVVYKKISPILKNQ